MLDFVYLSMDLELGVSLSLSLSHAHTHTHTHTHTHKKHTVFGGFPPGVPTTAFFLSAAGLCVPPKHPHLVLWKLNRRDCHMVAEILFFQPRCRWQLAPAWWVLDTVIFITIFFIINNTLILGNMLSSSSLSLSSIVLILICVGDVVSATSTISKWFLYLPGSVCLYGNLPITKLAGYLCV